MRRDEQAEWRGLSGQGAHSVQGHRGRDASSHTCPGPHKVHRERTPGKRGTLGADNESVELHQP